MNQSLRFFFHLLILGCLAIGTQTRSWGQNPAPVPAGEISFPTQVALGNIFVEGEKVEIQAAVQTGTSVDWTITDFEGKQVASGTAPVQDHKISIMPSIPGKGYWVVHLTSKGGSPGEAKTSYVVIAPADITKMPNSKFAVMTHFDQGMPIDFLPLMAKMGVSMVRDEQAWGNVEKTKGQFTFTDREEAYMAALKQLHLEPLTMLAFGNNFHDAQPGVPLYKLAPYSPEGISAYAAYCTAVLYHYGDQIKVVEIWNEYNGSFVGGKAAENRPKAYTAMLKEAYTQIKAARPDVTVLGGATVKIPLPYIEKLFKEGALQYMDAFAVHPYQEPEGVEEDITQLIDLMKKYNNGQSKPIWATEVSHFADSTTERGAVASHLVRMYTLLMTHPEVQKISWYLSRDYLKQFANLGLIHEETDPMGKFTPVAPYAAYSNLIHYLYGTDFKQREATDSRTRVYRFDTATQSVWVCWSTFQEAHLTFAASGPIKLVNIVGGETPLTPTNGQVSLTVSGNFPVYVVADKGVVSAVAETPRKDQVLADSARDFSGEQGKGGWSYLYFGSNKDGSAPYDPGKALPMTWAPSPGDWADNWAGPSDYFMLGQGGAHPGGINGGQGWAILRWTSDQTGPVHIIGKVDRGADGDGVGVMVFQDGKSIYNTMLLPKTSADIDLNPTVAKGTQVDFVVTPGPGTETSFDATGLRATILTPSK